MTQKIVHKLDVIFIGIYVLKVNIHNFNGMTIVYNAPVSISDINVSLISLPSEFSQQLPELHPAHVSRGQAEF